MSTITPHTQPLYYKGDRELPGVHILKLICAFLVVQIHCPTPSLSFILAPTTLIAVPIFFIISGYFLLNSYETIHRQKLTHLIIKILKLYVFVSAVFLLYDAIVDSSRHFYNPGLRFLATGTIIAFHLWYLTAFMQALVVILVATRFKAQKWLIWLIPIGLIMNLAIGRYNFLVSDYGVPNDLVWSRNVLTIGIPCILIGMLLRRFEHKLPPTRTLFMVAVGLGIAMYTESHALAVFDIHLTGDIIFFTVPCAAAVFTVFLRLEVKGSIADSLVSLGRHYTLDIYVWHLLVIFILADFFSDTYLHGATGISVFFITLAGAMFLRRTGLRRIYA